MDNWKRILWKFIFPHISIVIAIAIISIVGLAYSFSYPNAISIVRYGFYGVSAYAMLVICFRLPRSIKQINQYWKKNFYVSRYLSDEGLRVKISLYGSVSTNLLYAAFNIFLGYVKHSVWFYSIAGYYVLITLIRGFLLKDTHKNTEPPMINQWKRYRFCGALLIVMNVVLSAIVFYIVYQNKGFTYHFIQTIAMAAYTFTITILAIVNVIRHRKSKQPLISAVKFISFAAALVSMLSLENAMLNTFGQTDGENFRQLMTALTGAGVCIIVLIMGIYMVVKSTRCIKQIRSSHIA